MHPLSLSRKPFLNHYCYQIVPVPSSSFTPPSHYSSVSKQRPPVSWEGALVCALQCQTLGSLTLYPQIHFPLWVRRGPCSAGLICAKVLGWRKLSAKWKVPKEQSAQWSPSTICVLYVLCGYPSCASGCMCAHVDSFSYPTNNSIVLDFFFIGKLEIL